MSLLCQRQIPSCSAPPAIRAPVSWTCQRPPFLTYYIDLFSIGLSMINDVHIWVYRNNDKAWVLSVNCVGAYFKGVLLFLGILTKEKESKVINTTSLM